MSDIILHLDNVERPYAEFKSEDALMWADAFLEPARTRWVSSNVLLLTEKDIDYLEYVAMCSDLSVEKI